MNNSNSIISVEDIKVELGGVSVLDIPSFCLNSKEFVSLIGPNGSGKSTFLLVLNCLLKPVSGRISYRGNDILSRDDVIRFRRRISMVFQEPLLFDTTVYKNVASGLNIRGVKRAEIHERVMRYLKWFNIEHLAHRSARKLSGGESQRTSLARAFAIEPEVIFLDEPFSALDPPTRHAITDDLETIVRQTGITTVMVTHDQSEALRMSDRIAVMNVGKIVQTGVPSLVMNNPVNEFVANFVGMDTILEGRVEEALDGMVTVSVAGREIEAVGRLQPGDKAYCCIRPENVAIELRDPDDLTTARNVFPAKIVDIDSMGPFLKVTLDCGFPLVSFVTREAFASLGLDEGKPVFATFKATAVHLIQGSEQKF
ncbi:MAG TPA: ABC transporter ATP-binding protein [Geobacteraceae bacterium]|nr:ABC transporter ATP-binding protein [Geobacteraceae bacterium]